MQMKKRHAGQHDLAQSVRRRPLARVIGRELSQGELASVAGGYISWDILTKSGGSMPDPDASA
jgi:hypothetical protein